MEEYSVELDSEVNLQEVDIIVSSSSLDSRKLTTVMSSLVFLAGVPGSLTAVGKRPIDVLEIVLVDGYDCIIDVEGIDGAEE